jgi:hypothetical protein
MMGWKPIATAPKDASWHLVRNEKKKEFLAHWASDLSGSEQPPFQGWFERVGDLYFSRLEPQPTEWWD